jgi:putative endonuclease
MLKQLLGKFAENLAEKLLASRGLRILQRNYRCRMGEIDLIVQDGDSVVFVEVRSRSRRDYGSAAESITLTKQRRIIAAARHFLATLPRIPACRFDVVTLDESGESEWIKSAFEDMG